MAGSDHAEPSAVEAPAPTSPRSDFAPGAVTAPLSSGIRAPESVLAMLAGAGADQRAEIIGALQRTAGNRTVTRLLQDRSRPVVQRAVRVNAPARGATGAAHIPAFLARLNAVSEGLTWTLAGDVLAYAPRPGTQPSDFDRRIQAVVDQPAVIPLRMITRQGRSRDIAPVGAPPNPLGPVEVDQLQEGYVDVEDMLAGDDDSFRLNLIHILVERATVPDYARRVGTDMSGSFGRAHAAGLRAERDHLRARIGDPDLGNAIESQVGNTLRFTYRGRGYTVRHDLAATGAGTLDTGRVTVRVGRETLSLDAFIARRRAAEHARELNQANGGPVPRGVQVGP